jgi:plasmid stabilization system protein ParE
MSLPVILRPEAEADVREIFRYLEDAQAGLGAKFTVRLRELLERIEFMPELYGIVWQDVRAARLRKFRYAVYHVTFADRVEVLAVMHGARDPAAWQTRV